MVPKLYAGDGTTFLATLSDTTVCEITEERNGIYELYLEIPTASAQFPLIENDCWVQAKPSDAGNDQRFRVYSVEKSMRGVAIVQAEHISYLLAAYPVDEVITSNATPTQAMSALLDRAATLLPSHHGFSAVSDIATASNFAISAVSARAALGGVQGSVLQRYGGEFEFDSKIVRLYRARGKDNGIRIEYAKNLRALKATVSTEGSFTGIFPFVKNEETLLFLPEKILWAENKSGVQRRVMVKDFSQDLFENPTEARLRAAAESYLNANDINAPDISLEVDFVSLWQSPEYAAYRDLEHVALCDTVTVRHPDLGVDVRAKVIKTVFDSLKERYKKITVGSAKSNMAAVLAGIREEIDAIEAPDISALQTLINQAVEDATNAITGNSGGKVILNPARNPQELLVLTDANSSIQTAIRLWRWNADGFGFSSNGYNGPYRTAITSDGQIVADFITTGTLTANVIRAGIIRSVDGSSFFDLDGNKIQTANAVITGGQISIGGGGFRTEIAAGQLSQYALGDGTFVCGLTPFSAGNEYRPTLFVGSNSRVTGFSISHQENNGNITNIAQFDKTKIDLIKPVRIENGISGGGNITITGTVNTNSGSANTFAAVNHYRFVSGYGDAQIKFGCGSITASGNTFASAALEMGYSGYSTPAARLDIFPSWGAAVMCLRGMGGGSNSGILEMGTTTMWWRGSEIAVNSSAEKKSSIKPASSALDKILATGVYTYKYKEDDQGEDEDGDQRTGFVLGKGYTPPPAEVVGEDGASVNLYATSALAWKGIQELTAQVTALQDTVKALQAEVQALKGGKNNAQD